MNIEELIAKAESFNKGEIMKYNPDMQFLQDVSDAAALRLAKEYNADEKVLRVAMQMMDSKLPEARHLGIPKEHVKMSAEATRELLKDADCLDENAKENIIKCVEQHHGVEKYYSIEAEIIANADCYRFIHPKGVFFYASMLGRRHHEFEKELEQLDFKLNEKHNALSLPMAKAELEPYYEFFQKAINEARK